MTKRSGTSRSYAERAAKGQPNKTYSLPAEAVEAIDRLAVAWGLSRSGVVARMALEAWAAESRKQKK